MVRKQDRSFDEMTSEMASYYADKKPGAKELVEGGLYALQEDELFYRSGRKSISITKDRTKCIKKLTAFL